MDRRKKKRPAPKGKSEYAECVDRVFKKWMTKEGRQEYHLLTAPLLAERREQYHIRPDELHPASLPRRPSRAGHFSSRS